MKSNIVLELAILFIVQSCFENVEAKMTVAQLANMLMPTRNTCIQKTGVTADLVDAPKTGPMPDTPELRCYYACMMKMMRVVTNDGLPDRDNIRKQMDIMLLADDKLAKLQDILRLCAPQITSTEACEANWQFLKCCYDIDKVLFFP